MGHNLAKNVVRLRKERGWTQEMLAEFSELSQTAITQIENQRRWPEIETISKLANAFKVSEETLFLPESMVLQKEDITVFDALVVLARHFGYDLKKNKRKN